MDLFVVNFDVRALDEIVLVSFRFDSGNKLLKSPWNDSFEIVFGLYLPHHCVCLSRTRLPVGENGPIVALDNLFDKLLACRFVDVGLGFGLGKDTIKTEYLDFLIFFSRFK